MVIEKLSAILNNKYLDLNTSSKKMGVNVHTISAFLISLL